MMMMVMVVMILLVLLLLTPLLLQRHVLRLESNFPQFSSVILIELQT
jgi:hypothetical protein